MSVSFSQIVHRARPKSNHVASQAFRDVLAKIPVTTLMTTGNGIRVAAEENPIAKFATVGVCLESGTRHDPEGYCGTTRVFEKCGFLGTTNQSREDISKALDEIGGQLAVKVDRETTFLSVKVAPENVNRAVSIIADVVKNARFSDEDISTAKKLVETQRHEFEDRPDDVTEDNLWRQAFDSTTVGLGAPLYGDEQEIKAVTKEVLQSYRSKNVVGSRLVVVGSGAVNQTELEKATTQYFGDLAKGDNKPLVDTRFIGGEFKLWNLRFKTCHTMWAFETCGAKCEDSLALQLVTQITGNFHRSQHELGQHAVHRAMKMFCGHDQVGPTETHLHEKALEIANSFCKQYSDAGLCGMYLVTRPQPTSPGDASSHQEFIQVTMAEWCRMSQKVLHPIELEQAKVNLKAQLLYNMDGATNSALDIARQVQLYGRRVPLEEMYARIDDITPNNCQEVLHHYFYGRKPVFSHMGYTYPIAGYDWSHHWTYKFFY